MGGGTNFVDVSTEQAAAIRATPHFRDGLYRDLDIARTLEFYQKRYVGPALAAAPLGPEQVVVDIGCGYGWLAMAFAAMTEAKVVAVDLDGPRLEAGERIAGVLGVADKIDWRVGGLQDLPLDDRSSDLTYCVEVLEHIQRDRRGLDELARVSRDRLVVTTPNLWFPVIAHDTQLPFCHWLPKPWRLRYAAWAGRTNTENDNLFFSPLDLQRGFRDFEMISGFLHYKDIDEYFGHFPFYLPYVNGGLSRAPGRFQSFYYRAAAKLGRGSFYVLPNLASAWRRKG